MKSKKIQELGITLVALVVTIIILLILAGVTISLVLGNNGVIDRAKTASNVWEKATENETAMMNEAEEQVISLSNTIDSEPGILMETSFEIYGDTFFFEPGMKWREWIQSPYNR